MEPVGDAGPNSIGKEVIVFQLRKYFSGKGPDKRTFLHMMCMNHALLIILTHPRVIGLGPRPPTDRVD